MKANERKLWIIVTLVLALALVLVKSCEKSAKPCPEQVVAPKGATKTVTETVDTTTVINQGTTPVYKPVPRITLPAMAKAKFCRVDTQAIIDHYLATRKVKGEEYTVAPEDAEQYSVVPEDADLNVYRDSVLLATGAYYGVEDTVQGQILGRQFFHRLPQHTITKQREVVLTQPKRAQVYGGFEFYGNELDPLKYVGAELLLKTRGNMIYKAGVLSDFNLKAGQPLIYKTGALFLLKFSDR